LRLKNIFGYAQRPIQKNRPFLDCAHPYFYYCRICYFLDYQTRMIKPLTSLRFFFALFVFFYHLFFWNHQPGTFLQWVHDFIFKEGYIGVSFFFILSGFILAYNYGDKFKEGTATKEKFWMARFSRIYPLHFFTLIIAIALEFLYEPSGKLINYIIAHLTLIQSFIPYTDYNVSLNGPAWSISDEAFFYFMFPVLIFIRNKSNVLFNALLIILALVVIVSGFLLKGDFAIWAMNFNPLFRIVDFCIGISLFFLYRNMSITVRQGNALELISIGLLVILFCFHSYVKGLLRISVYYWPAMALVIFSFAFQKGYLSKLLSHPKMILLGEISFAFYMVHTLIIRLFMFLVGNYNNIFSIGVTLTLTLIASYFLHFYVELPFIKLLRGKKSVAK
jgi:peptidoglycan/LPS O-acetylase OafA/YrhL